MDSPSSPVLLWHTCYRKALVGKTNSKAASIFQVEKSLLSTKSSMESKGRSSPEQRCRVTKPSPAAGTASLLLTLTMKPWAFTFLLSPEKVCLGGSPGRLGPFERVGVGPAHPNCGWASSQPPGLYTSFPAHPAFAKGRQLGLHYWGKSNYEKQSQNYQILMYLFTLHKFHRPRSWSQRFWDMQQNSYFLQTGIRSPATSHYLETPSQLSLC